MPHRAGFTLIELIILITILLILVVTAMPAFFNIWTDMRLENAAHKLIMHLEYVRRIIMTRQAAYIVTFDGYTYAVDLQDPEDPAKGNITGPDFGTIPIAGSLGFDTAGSPIDPVSGNVYSADYDIPIDQGEKNRTVRVSAYVGNMFVVRE